MIGDSGENDGEAGRLLSARERAAVACHVAEQLLICAEFARLRRPAEPPVRRAISALLAPPPAALSPAMAGAADVCATIVDWLSGTSPCYPTLDDVLRGIEKTLRAMDSEERQNAAPLAMAGCILASAAMAKSRLLDGQAFPSSSEMVGTMVAAAAAHAGERVLEIAG